MGANVAVRNFQPVEVDVTLTADTLIYASGDVLSDTAEVAIMSNPPSDGVRGKIVGAVVYDRDDQGVNLDIVFLKTNVSLGTKNAAPDITDDNAMEVIGTIAVTSYTDLTTSQVAASALASPIYFQTAADSGSIYVSTISRGTGTYTASGLRLKLFIEPANVAL